jgi:hypothetical protein
VGDRVARFGVEWLEQHASAARCDPRRDERVRVGELQQAGFDPTPRAKSSSHSATIPASP